MGVDGTTYRIHKCTEDFLWLKSLRTCNIEIKGKQIENFTDYQWYSLDLVGLILNGGVNLILGSDAIHQSIGGRDKENLSLLIEIFEVKNHHLTFLKLVQSLPLTRRS